MRQNGVWEMVLTLLINGPYFLALFIGAVIAVVRWPRQPLVSGLVFVACGLLGSVTFTRLLATRWLSANMDSLGLSPSDLGTVFMVLSIIDSIVATVATVLFITAAFVRRGHPLDRGLRGPDKLASPVTAETPPN